MQFRRYEIQMKGETPLLMHADNLAWADVVDKWRKDPANKKGSVAGDDRSPAWRWVGCLYVENDIVVIPSDNLMTVLREGGAKCPTGRGRGTFKALTQSGILVDQSAWPLLAGGAEVGYGAIKRLIGNPEFAEHDQACKSLGFELFVKRAKIGQAKHVRVRPRFDDWACQGTVTVLDESITTEALQNILTFAGAYAGIGDWRPSSKQSPGRFGRFSATVKLLK